MIVNEIAKFENPLHAAVQLLLVAHLREPLLVRVLDAAESVAKCILSSCTQPRSSPVKVCWSDL